MPEPGHRADDEPLKHSLRIRLSRRAREWRGGPCQRTDRHRLVLEADGPVEVIWDPAWLDQVLANLLTNAPEILARGWGRASLGAGAGRPCHCDDQRSGDWNESTGASQAVRAVPACPRAWMVSGGLGLGLHIAAEIVKQYGGRMGVASEPGKGSAFTITLSR